MNTHIDAYKYKQHVARPSAWYFVCLCIFYLDVFSVCASLPCVLQVYMYIDRCIYMITRCAYDDLLI